MVVALLLLFGLAFSQTETQTQPQPQPQNQVVPEFGKDLPPPQLPPPQELVIEERIDYQKISPKELEKLVKEMDEKDKIRLLQKGLRYGGEKELVLRGSNYFYYHPAIPVLFVFKGKEIEDVVLWSGGAKAVFKDQNLVIFPPEREEGKLFGFVVFFKDGKAVSFIGERVNPLKEKFQVANYYEYVERREVPKEKVIEAFLREYGRCPKSGEVVVVDGRHFIFEKTEGSIASGKDQVFACGVVYRIREF